MIAGEVKCECFLTDERYWFWHYGMVEPASQWEWNPECPEHGEQRNG